MIFIEIFIRARNRLKLMKKFNSLVWFLLATMVCGVFMTVPLKTNTATDFAQNESANVQEEPIKANTPTPTLFYEFDDYSDSRAIGPNGIPVGGTYIASGGIRGNCLYIPAQSDELIIPLGPEVLALEEFTVQFWFKQYSGYSITQNLIQKGNLSTQSSFYIFRYPWDAYNTATVIAGHGTSMGQWNQVSNPNNLSFGEWHLVTYVKAQEWHGYWIDAKCIYTASITEEVYNTTDPIRIGVNAMALYFDELMIWNFYISESAIQEYYQEFYPMADFFFDKQYIYYGESVQFYDQTVGGYQPYYYQWYFDDGTYSNDQNPLHYFYNVGKTVFEVTLRVTDALGNVSIAKNMIYILNSVGDVVLFSEVGDYASDGRIKLNWTYAENATNYELYEDEYLVANVPSSQRTYELIKTVPGTYQYRVRAVGPTGFRDSNFVIITTDLFPGAFSLWSYEAGNPDQDGQFTLQWGESLNAEYFEVYENRRLIQTVNQATRSLQISVNRSGVYEYYVCAKNSRGIFNSNNISITVSLGTNQTGNPNQNSGNFDNILKVLQENAGLIAGGTVAATIIGTILKVLKGRKGKIKVKIPKTPLDGSIVSNDDFFDSDL